MGTKLTTEQFIEKAIAVHGDKYDYSMSEYTNCRSKIAIICKKHGEFLQIADQHLRLSAGCPTCANKNFTVDTFLDKAYSVHGNKFDYSKVKYVNSQTKIEIICLTHGSFFQVPASHLTGRGCLKCKLVSGPNVSKEETEWLDSMNNDNLIRQHPVYISDSMFIVDGFDPSTNTVYEYNGKYWHGHPDVFPDRTASHPVSKILVETLYQNTILREQILTEMGFSVVSLWK